MYHKCIKIFNSFPILLNTDKTNVPQLKLLEFPLLYMQLNIFIIKNIWILFSQNRNETIQGYIYVCIIAIFVPITGKGRK